MPAHLPLLSVANVCPNGSGSQKRTLQNPQLCKMCAFWNHSRAPYHSAEPSRHGWSRGRKTLYYTLTLYVRTCNCEVIAKLQEEFAAGVYFLGALGCFALCLNNALLNKRSTSKGCPDKECYSRKDCSESSREDSCKIVSTTTHSGVLIFPFEN